MVAMSRVPVAIFAGIVGFFAYIALAVLVADVVRTFHWSLQALYFMIAGVAWAAPARWLMFWSVGQR